MGEAGFYHPDRQCLVPCVRCVCVCASACDWCAVLCCMSRRMIGLLIFPLAEHKSLFYPPSLNLSRVKCLRSQLLASRLLRAQVCAAAAAAAFYSPRFFFFARSAGWSKWLQGSVTSYLSREWRRTRGVNVYFIRTQTLQRQALQRERVQKIWEGGRKDKRSQMWHTSTSNFGQIGLICYF